ncbi:MAG TPA: hypothetical protein EYG38_06350 [Verrucomicrobia bacterium]|nr:hypothetical protein [Verrucomicrobiota bacterium]
MVTEDISQGSYEEILYEYRHYPILKKYSSQDLDEFFGFRNTKVLGFSKSGLSKSIYQELKEFRVNKPESGANSTKRKRDDKPETRSPDSASRQRRQGERIEKNRDSGIGDPPD